MRPPRLGHPHLGLGVGLRTVHFRHILEHRPAVDWFEIISENFMDSRRPAALRAGADRRALPGRHARRLAVDRQHRSARFRVSRASSSGWPTTCSARWVSDHLCWTGVAGLNTHDLLPMPLNERDAGARRRAHPHRAGCPRAAAGAGEPQHLRDASPTRRCPSGSFSRGWPSEADCGLLLDVNNVYVSSVNHDFDPVEYIRSVPHERVVQFHLAGHTNCGTHLIDTHDGQVIDPVWELYRLAPRADRRRLDAAGMGRQDPGLLRACTPRCSRPATVSKRGGLAPA